MRKQLCNYIFEEQKKGVKITDPRGRSTIATVEATEQFYNELLASKESIMPVELKIEGLGLDIDIKQVQKNLAEYLPGLQIVNSRQTTARVKGKTTMSFSIWIEGTYQGTRTKLTNLVTSNEIIFAGTTCDFVRVCIKYNNRWHGKNMEVRRRA